MGRKKAFGASANTSSRPFCFFCDRNFDDEGVLIQHQRAKHYRCPECDDGAIRGKCESVQGLIVHTLKVHGKSLARVPNAMQGRDNPELNVYGMDGIPEHILESKGYKPPESREPAAKQPRLDPPPPTAVPLPPLPGMPPFPGLPGMPPGAEMPGFPGLPAPPTAPGAPGAPEMPGFPGLPAPPSLPGGAALPGFPGLPGPPGSSAPPEMPGFPGLPAPGLPPTAAPDMSQFSALTSSTMPGLGGFPPPTSAPAPLPALPPGPNVSSLLGSGASGLPSLTHSDPTMPPMLSLPPPSTSQPPASGLIEPPPDSLPGEDVSAEEQRAKEIRYRTPKS